jgi:hypothetical protein
MYNIENILSLEKFNTVIKEIHIKNDGLRLLKYNKSKCNQNNFNTFGRLRSVILDENNNCLMFSPPKSMPASLFMNKFNLNTCIVEDFIEGTMINVFWNMYKQDWDISTKSVYNAITSFDLNGMLFNEMFFECINHTKLDISILDKNVTWSFVMQHPNNQIVNKISSPELYLVECYKTNAFFLDKSPVEKIYNIKEKYGELFIGTTVKFVEQHKNYSSYAEIFNLLENKDLLLPAIVIKSQTGERCKIMNPRYKHIHDLRANTSNKLIRFLELTKVNKVNEYLKYYPEDTTLFDSKLKLILKLTDDMYSTYVKIFIKKEMKFKELNKDLKPIIWNIHELYKQRCVQSNNKKGINKSEVFDIITKVVNKFVIVKILTA